VTTSPRRIRLRLAAAALAACGATLMTALVTAPLAHAADSTNYGIRPADSPDHFRLELAPGAVTERTTVVSNRSPNTVTFKVYAADATTTPQGGFALQSNAAPRTGVGAWVHLPIGSVTVKPGSQVEVPFRLTVPEHATPGDYTGGILIEPPPRAGKPAEVGNQTAVQLNIVERVGVRVYLRVAGVAVPKLSAGPLTATKTGRDLEFAVTVKNTGNVVLHPNGAIDVRGWPGAAKRLRFSEVESLLPGETVTLRATWPNPPALKWGRAAATITHEGGTERATAGVHLVPLLPAAAGGLLLILAVWLGARFARFVRRARRALAQAAVPVQPVAHLGGSGISPAEPSQPLRRRTGEPGRHRADMAGRQ
jgi:hypothetical protein